MKYFALFSVLAMLVATGAAAARTRGGSNGGSNDGALSVKNAEGRVIIKGRGAVIGRFDAGQVTISDPNPNDGTGPIVTGADGARSINEKTTRYNGSNIRFRIIGGSFSIIVFGTDIDLSAIGRGMVVLDGENDDGTYAVNGGPAQPFPTFRFTFPLPLPGG